MLEKLEELLIPIRAAFAATAGLPDYRIDLLNRHLLFEMPALGLETGIILGATRATAFVVDKAVKAGHTKFIVLGGKPVGQEDPRFTDYILPLLKDSGLPLPPDPQMAEKDYAAFLLTEHFGIPAENITVLDDDRSRHTNANMQVLKAHGLCEGSEALEFYSLSGTARRVLMTAHKVLGDSPVISVHNAFPPGMTKDNWFEKAVGRAFMTAESSKILTDNPDDLRQNPLYVRMGHCKNVDLIQAIRSAEQKKNPVTNSSIEMKTLSL